MGLTIHYSLRSNARSIAAVRQVVERLRQRPLDLPFKEVGPLIVLSGEECQYEHREQSDPLRWLLVQASQYVEKNGRHYTVCPSHVIAFDAWPGDGCESSNMGLCRYPSFIAKLKTEKLSGKTLELGSPIPPYRFNYVTPFH